MTCFGLMLLISTASSAQPQAPREGSQAEEVRFRSGSLQLTGLWFRPAGQGPHPAAVIVRGSGSSRRDNPWARLFVDQLLDRGIAALLLDKRGSGGSEGDWRTATFDDRATDALAALAHVRSRAEVDPDRVGLVGLSQGGRVVPVAAARSPRVAFVVNVVGSAVPFTEQIHHEMEHTFREAGLSGASLEAALQLHMLAEGVVREEVPWAEYRAALDSALASEWADAARGFPGTRDDWRWGFFRGVIDFDPIPYWRCVEAPTLVLYGSEDTNAPTDRSVERLEEAFRDAGPSRYEIRVFEGLGHGLLAPMESTSHRLKLHSDVERVLSDWLDAVVGAEEDEYRALRPDTSRRIAAHEPRGRIEEVGEGLWALVSTPLAGGPNARRILANERWVGGGQTTAIIGPTAA